NNPSAGLPVPVPSPSPGGNGFHLPPPGPYPAGWGAGFPGSPASAPTLNALTLLLALRRRWGLALGPGLPGGAGAATAAWFIMPPPTYKARAMVHLASTPEFFVNKQVHDAGVDFSYFQKTQLTVVKSQLVLNAALRQPEVAQLSTVAEKPSALEWLT